MTGRYCFASGEALSPNGLLRLEERSCTFATMENKEAETSIHSLVMDSVNAMRTTWNVNIGFPPEVGEAIETAATEKGWSPSVFCRNVIADYMTAQGTANASRAANSAAPEAK